MVKCVERFEENDDANIFDVCVSMNIQDYLSTPIPLKKYSEWMSEFRKRR